MDWKRKLYNQASVTEVKKKNLKRIGDLIAKHKADPLSLSPDERLFLAGEVAARQDQIKKKMDEKPSE
jgi:hypothetical protein